MNELQQEELILSTRWINSKLDIPTAKEINPIINF